MLKNIFKYPFSDPVSFGSVGLYRGTFPAVFDWICTPSNWLFLVQISSYKVFNDQIHSLIFTNPVKSWVDHDLIPHSSLFLFLNPSYWTAFGYNKIIFSENSISKSLRKLNQFFVPEQFSVRHLFLAFMAFINSMIHEFAQMIWARKPIWYGL